MIVDSGPLVFYADLTESLVERTARLYHFESDQLEAKRELRL